MIILYLSLKIFMHQKYLNFKRMQAFSEKICNIRNDEEFFSWVEILPLINLDSYEILENIINFKYIR